MTGGKKLREMLQDRERIFYDLGRDPLFDQRLIGWLNEFRGKSRTIAGTLVADAPEGEPES